MVYENGKTELKVVSKKIKLVSVEKIYNHWLTLMIGAFQDNYGGDIKFLFGIKMKKFIVELMLQEDG